MQIIQAALDMQRVCGDTKWNVMTLLWLVIIFIFFEELNCTRLRLKEYAHPLLRGVAIMS